MKSTGIVRKIDGLGRVVIPKELRRTLSIVEGDPVEIFVDEDQIILKKYVPGNACIVTGDISNQNLVLFGGKFVLSNEGAELLIKELKKQIK